MVPQSLSPLLKLRDVFEGKLGKTDAEGCTYSRYSRQATKVTKEKTCDLASALGKTLLSLGLPNQNNNKESRISKSLCNRDSGRAPLLLLLLCLVLAGQSAVGQRARAG